ncbi:MAG: hypothetical protein GTN83_01890 [Acidobacteria bacterium]|nr:hypothetical protein [Acidobacteriota bacterium]
MIGATATGFRRALGSPLLIVSAWLLTVLAALPITVVLGTSLQESFGRTLAAEPMAEGFDSSWYGEYRGSARGIEKSFDPTLAGPGGVLANLEGWIRGSAFQQFAGLTGVALLFVLLWAVLIGGAIERYAYPDGPRGIAAILSSGGRYWGRFVRLALLSGAVYYGVYWLHRWVMKVLERRLLDVTEETRAMWATLAVYAGTALLLVFVRACFDYAKITIVIEDRRSALLSAVQGILFVAMHPFSAIGVVLLVGVVAAFPLSLYVWLRPSLITPGWAGIVYAIVVGQAWMLARLTLRLSLLGAQTALYQSAGSASPRRL